MAAPAPPAIVAPPPTPPLLATADADDAPPEDSSVAPAARQARGYGELNVLTTPVYATVFAAGRRLGTTPLYRARLPAGSWTLRLQGAGRVRSVRVQIRPGKVTSISVPLNNEDR